MTQLLTDGVLEKLSTHRLLEYKRKLMYPAHWVEDDYVWDCDCRSCTEQKERIKIYSERVEAVKKVLSTREHVERKTKVTHTRKRRVRI